MPLNDLVNTAHSEVAHFNPLLLAGEMAVVHLGERPLKVSRQTSKMRERVCPNSDA